VPDLLVEQGEWTLLGGPLAEAHEGSDGACGCLMVMEDIGRSHGVDGDWIDAPDNNKHRRWRDGWMEVIERGVDWYRRVDE